MRAGNSGVRETSDHARECVVRAGRMSANLGRRPDPAMRPTLAKLKTGIAHAKAQSRKNARKEIRWPANG